MFQSDLDGGFGAAAKDAGSAFLGSLANQLSSTKPEKTTDQNQPQNIAGTPTAQSSNIVGGMSNPKALMFGGGVLLIVVTLIIVANK